MSGQGQGCGACAPHLPSRLLAHRPNLYPFRSLASTPPRPARFVTYKWPSWLHKQTEKQRIIWAYKILFLDVLFPLGLRKVIFCDSDQVVRADLRELWDMDLQVGAAVPSFLPSLLPACLPPPRSADALGLLASRCTPTCTLPPTIPLTVSRIERPALHPLLRHQPRHGLPRAP